MGRKCCVPECRSNYRHETVYTTVFKFPSTPNERNLWIKSINRVNFEPSPTAAVCIKHFEERFIIREDRAVRDDGSVLVVKRKNVALTKDAFPTIFENQPSYLTKTLPPVRKAPAERQKEIVKRDELNFQQWCSDDTITSFEQFTKECCSKLNNKWHFLKRSNFALLYRIDDTDCPKIVVSFKVYEDLMIKIYHENTELDINSFIWLLGSEKKCDKWTKFDSLLSHLLSYEVNSLSVKQTLSIAINFFEKCCNSNEIKCNEDLNSRFKFIKLQMMLLNVSRLRYSTNLILWCSKLYFTYPAAYCLIRESKVLTLPHPCYLKKLSMVCSATCQASTHTAYLKKKVSLLKEHEKIVNILLDEIYVNPSINYKAGHIVGVSEHDNVEATTIQAFMVSSMLSKNKDVVALFPVRNLTADVLLRYTREVLQVVHD